MSARQLAHVCLFLFGVYLIVEALTQLTGAFTERPILMYSGEEPIPGVLSSVGWSVIAGLVGAVVLGFIPGAILIAKSRRWAEAWFPDTGLSSLSVSALLPVGLVLLGLDFGIGGLASVLGGAVQVIGSSELASTYGLRSLGSGAVYLIGGIALLAFGRSLARNAA